MRRVLRWFLKSFFVQWFLIKILPRVRFSFEPPKMDGKQYFDFQSFIPRGAILFSTDRSKLAGMFIPGKWDHAAIYIGGGKLIEAHQPSVRMSTIFDFCHTSDFVGIGYFPFENLDDVIDTAKSCIGKPYDTFFEPGKEALYCSELIAALDPENKMGFDTSDVVGLGMPYVSPDDLWKAKNIRQIFDGEKYQ